MLTATTAIDPRRPASLMMAVNEALADGSHNSARCPAEEAPAAGDSPTSPPMALTPNVVSDTTSPASTAASGTPLRRLHLDEAAINYNTLHLPVRFLELDATEPPQAAADEILLEKERVTATAAASDMRGGIGSAESSGTTGGASSGMPSDDEPYTTLVTLFKPSPSAHLGIVLSGDAPEPPIITEVRSSGLAAAAANARGEIVPGMALLSVNGREVHGHVEASAALGELRGHAVLQLRAPAGPVSRAARALARRETAFLTTLLRGLLERDASDRLCDHRRVAAHAFFADVDWVLLAAHELPAPFTPDPHVVYAKDYIAPLSVTGGGKKRSSEAAAQAENELPEVQLAADMQGGWSYVCSPEIYAQEVGEYVRKSTTEQLVVRARRGTRESKGSTEADVASWESFSHADDSDVNSDEDRQQPSVGEASSTRKSSSPVVHPVPVWPDDLANA